MLPNSFESRIDTLIVGFGPEIPLPAIRVIVDFHETLMSEVRHVAGDRSVRFAVADAL